MTNKNKRRSVSLKGLTYQRLKNHCDREGRTVSGWLEDVLEERFTELGVPPEEVLKPSEPSKTKRPGDGSLKVGGIFTF